MIWFRDRILRGKWIRQVEALLRRPNTALKIEHGTAGQIQHTALAQQPQWPALKLQDIPKQLQDGQYLITEAADSLLWLPVVEG